MQPFDMPPLWELSRCELRDPHHICELFINNANQLYVFLQPDRKHHSRSHSQALARRRLLTSFFA
ncbi:hypothetical protein KL86DES1_10525 [uncultured Desulfovibrio sp.]|uniref:Uncharacterized protein n=1 Tax=uncultured Desulfovibrio sp. TaxID=167968 RepID=A0A212KZD9_9BACT|nr:hypothetical protein KL86DES1_10525 [uncultured Desulfovibrio sp.]VZH32399.1 conserved protein of unknown function [Desulfovibrio sp. 86]